jgi:S1-C subfamily serine protease
VVGGARPLTAGTYFVRLGTYVEGPVLSSLVARLLGPQERGATWGPGDPPALDSGVWVRGRTAPETSGVTWYAVNPPAGVRSVHALLLEASAPLDLLLARRSDGSVLTRAVTGRVDERLDHAFPGPLPADRRFLLGVASLTPGEGPAEFRVALGWDGPPTLPADMLWPRLLDLATLTPDERVAAATVELTGERSGGGSATCVSPKGLLLSCRHVLEDGEEPGELQRDGILVAFNRSLDRPPVQSFVARLVHEDAALDMALLELTADVFGRALPADLALPWVPLGESDALRLGDAITVFGYPQDGSEFTRTPVILSRGSVAGFESAAGVRTWIKTDAWIGPGHSGGTLVGPDHRLVAIPAATLGLNEAMGLAVPVARIPAPWRQRIDRDLKLPR